MVWGVDGIVGKRTFDYVYEEMLAGGSAGYGGAVALVLSLKVEELDQVGEVLCSECNSAPVVLHSVFSISNQSLFDPLQDSHKLLRKC